MSSFEVLYTFITFNDAKRPGQIVKEFGKAYKKSFFEKFCCQKKRIDQKYLYQDHKIRFKIPDHPGNVRWENLEFNDAYRMKNLCLLIILSIVIIFFSFLINLSLTAYIESSETVHCDQNEITVDLINKALDTDIQDQLRYCYCTQFSMTSILLNKESDEYNECYDFYLNELKSLGISVAIGIIISLVNIIIQSVIFKMVLFIRYRSITEIVEKQINFALVVEYINTSFVVYIIYLQILDHSVVEFINYLVNSDIFQIDNFITDVNRDWYIKVAGKLIMPMLLAIFNPQTGELITELFSSCLKRIKSRRVQTKREFMELH